MPRTRCSWDWVAEARGWASEARTGVTQKQIADRTGVTPGEVSRAIRALVNLPEELLRRSSWKRTVLQEIGAGSAELIKWAVALDKPPTTEEIRAKREGFPELPRPCRWCLMTTSLQRERTDELMAEFEVDVRRELGRDVDVFLSEFKVIARSDWDCLENK